MASPSAQIAKDQGNSAFKTGNYAEAIGHYSAAIIHDRASATYPLNRAAAYLKLSKFEDAERDCTTVLGISPRNAKAYFRRAQARVGTQRFVEAQSDLESALTIEPTNEAIKKELVEVKKVIEREKVQRKVKREPITVPSFPTAEHTETQIPTPKSTTPRKPRRTRTVPIEIVDTLEPEPTKPAAPTPTKDHLTPLQSRVLSPNATPASAPASLTPASQPPPAPTSTSHPSPSPTASATPPKPKPRAGAAIFHANGKKTILRSSDAPTPAAAPASSSSTPPVSKSDPLSSSGPPTMDIDPPPSTSTSTPTSPPPPTMNVDPISTISIPPPPQTHFQLTRTWNGIPSAVGRFEYLKQIPPSALPPLFKSSLDPSFLISLLKTFQELLISQPSSQTKPSIQSYLSALPSIPRFDTIVLFLSKGEKDVARDVLGRVGIEEELKKKWGI